MAYPATATSDLAPLDVERPPKTCMENSPMNKPKSVSLRMRHLRRLLGVNRQEFAGLLGFSERAVAGWEAGQSPLSHRIQRLFEFERLGAKLEATIGRDKVATWLRETRQAWDGRNALEVIAAGEVDRIWQLLFIESRSVDESAQS